MCQGVGEPSRYRARGRRHSVEQVSPAGRREPLCRSSAEAKGFVPTRARPRRLGKGALDLGEVELRGHGDVLRLEVIGANPSAAPPHFQFGIDGVRLTRE